MSDQGGFPGNGAPGHDDSDAAEPEIGSSDWLLQQLSGGRLTTRRQIREAEAAAAAAGIPLDSFPQQTGAIEPLPAEASAPAEPAATPAEPAASAEPAALAEPVAPAEPAVPTEPAVPAEPVASAEPAVPAEADDGESAEAREDERPRARFSWETGTIEPVEPEQIEPEQVERLAFPDDLAPKPAALAEPLPSAPAVPADPAPAEPVADPVPAVPATPPAEAFAPAPPVAAEPVIAESTPAAEPADADAPAAVAEDGGYFWGLTPNAQLDAAVHGATSEPVDPPLVAPAAAYDPNATQAFSREELAAALGRQPEAPVAPAAAEPLPAVDPLPVVEPPLAPADPTPTALFDAFAPEQSAPAVVEPSEAAASDTAASDPAASEAAAPEAIAPAEAPPIAWPAAFAAEPVVPVEAPGDAILDVAEPADADPAPHGTDWNDIHALFGSEDAEADTNEVPVQQPAASPATTPEPAEPASQPAAAPLSESTAPFATAPAVEQPAFPGDLAPLASEPVPAAPVPAVPASTLPPFEAALAAEPVSSAAPVSAAPVSAASAPAPASSPAELFGIVPLVPAEPATPAGTPPRRRMTRSTKTLLWIVGILVALVVIVGLYALGRWVASSNDDGKAPGSNAQGQADGKGAGGGSVAPATDSTPDASLPPTGTLPAGSYTWDQLRGGECLDPFTDPWAQRFTVVDCTAAHAAQLVYAAAYPADAFPGEDAIAQQINALCTAPGVIDLGAASAYDDLQVVASYPVDQKQWDAGQKDYYCFVERSSQQQLTGSLAGAGPQA